MTKQLRIALVYDRVNKWGGAERVLLALHELWPEAPLFTAVYNPQTAPWAASFAVRESFLGSFPFARTRHEFYPWLTQLAFESFSFDEFDVVISVASAEAKSIITKPPTLHVCYCLTPTRYLWSGYETYRAHPGFGRADRAVASFFSIVAPTFRRWDRVASSRPDYYIAISRAVEARIQTYYRRDPIAVIYPPVDGELFGQKSRRKPRERDYFLVVSRLVGYKRLDCIVDAFNTLGLPLVIIGSGTQESVLRHQAKDNVHFVSAYLTDGEMVGYYENCRAFISAAEEDFGIAAVEALASGKPVIAYGGGGIAEIVQNETVGVLFGEQTAVSLVGAVRQFQSIEFDADRCRRRARFFSKDRFMKEMKQTVETAYESYIEASDGAVISSL